MMGIGFTEMVVIAGIALVVIGPEKFPDFAKLVIRTIRDLRGYVDEVKMEVGKELKPLKKEMDALSRIDPEKYIDSLTNEAPPKPASSMPVNASDQKILDEAGEVYDGEFGTESKVGEEGPEPEGTVGYGDHSQSDPSVTAESPTAESPVESPAAEEEDEFDALKDRREPWGSEEPDPWTGR